MMTKKIFIVFLAACSVSLCACGRQAQEQEADVQEEQASTEEVERPLEEAAETAESAQEAGNSSETDQEPETQPTALKSDFSFADLNNLEFWFLSGAGAWRTVMTIEEDGSFAGTFSDSDMGDYGADYPNGTLYLCNFNGQFTQPEKVNDYTWATQIAEIHYEQTPDTQEIIDGTLRIYTDVYGLEDAEDILIYLPGTPLEGLSQEFLGWVGYYGSDIEEKTVLSYYALNNETHQYGFRSYDIIEELMSDISRTETRAAELEASMENDPLTQTEYNETSAQLYDLWDSALNRTWGVLQNVLDEEAMEKLTEEERAWISEKEQAAAEAGAAYEGGSMQPMAENMKAAEMTRERVYELLEFL